MIVEVKTIADNISSRPTELLVGCSDMPENAWVQFLKG